MAESIDWLQALVALDAEALEPVVIDETLGVLLKHQDDIVKLRSGGTADALASGAVARLLD